VLDHNFRRDDARCISIRNAYLARFPRSYLVKRDRGYANREKTGPIAAGAGNKVGAEYYTVISQLETGRGRIPSDRYLVWANALDIEPQEFVRKLMFYYDRYKVVWGNVTQAKRRTAPKASPLSLGHLFFSSERSLNLASCRRSRAGLLPRPSITTIRGFT
jgi:hypothetical protein